jgi:23S rRNA (cytosine1962-C5)-methyltransferase
MHRIDIAAQPMEEYELLDSGDGRKLERFGEIVLDRPDPQAVWHTTHAPEIWMTAHAQFTWSEGVLKKSERWKAVKELPKLWTLREDGAVFALSLKEFKHIGLFPEHAHQWREIAALGETHTGLRMLNLFGYTGAASVIAAMRGIEVTHVDASKQTMETLKENMALSGLAPDAIRTITEDALKFAKRLVNREEQFDIIVLDPPAFGRGPKGEVWKIEEGLPELVSLIPKLLSSNAKLVILNGYASGFAARTFGELLQDALKEKRGDITFGDIALAQKNSDRLLTTGIYASWKK